MEAAAHDTAELKQVICGPCSAWSIQGGSLVSQGRDGSRGCLWGVYASHVDPLQLY